MTITTVALMVMTGLPAVTARKLRSTCKLCRKPRPISMDAMGYLMNEGLGYFMEVGDGFKKKLGRYFCKKGKRQYLVLSPTLSVHSYNMC